MKPINVLSLCGGVETGLYELQQLNIPIGEYHTYEILPEAIAVSSHHFPFIQHHGDLNGVDFNQYKGFDLLLVGSSCQNLSRVRIESREVNKGLKGDKSKIFFECARALREVNPKWFMFENVIPSSDEDLKIMSEMIGTEPILINSDRFSAQSRERYYWTNIPYNHKFPICNLVLKDIMQKNVEDKYFYKKNFSTPDMNKKVCSLLEVNSMDINKRIYNPNAKSPTLTCINGGYHEKKVMDNGKPRKLTEIEYERLQCLPDNYTKVQLNGRILPYSKRCSLMGNGWNGETIKWILSGLINI